MATNVLIGIKIKPKEKKAIENFVELLHKEFSGKIILLQLFGSKVNGKFTDESDTDILIVLKEKNMEIEDKIFDIAMDILLKYRVDIAPKIYDVKEFEERKNYFSTFIKSALEEGIPLWKIA